MDYSFSLLDEPSEEEAQIQQAKAGVCINFFDKVAEGSYKVHSLESSSPSSTGSEKAKVAGRPMPRFPP